jgi:hypothetical protein
MNTKFKIIVFAMLVATFSSCQGQSSVNYANELQDCLPVSDIELLNSLTTKFEKHLRSSYDVDLTSSYKKYLQSLATGDFPKDFFQYSTFQEDMDKFRNSDFYQRSWVKTSSFDEEAIIDVPLTVSDGEIQKQGPHDPIVLDPSGKYLNCLVEKNESKAINDYIEILKLGIDISPGLVAKALNENISSEELNDGLTRLIIAINFHYQIGLLMTEK